MVRCLSPQEYAVKNDSLECFLTYADNNAVGYFAKQGFTKEITFSGERVRRSLALCMRWPQHLVNYSPQYAALSYSRFCFG